MNPKTSWWVRLYAWWSKRRNVLPFQVAQVVADEMEDRLDEMSWRMGALEAKLYTRTSGNHQEKP